MKKKEIIKLIKNRHDLVKAEKLAKIRYPDFSSIPELKKEFETLLSEVEESKHVIDVCDKENKDKCCNHDIRMTYRNIFFSTSVCVLCGKSINGNNCLNGTIYNDPNRNRRYVSFPGDYEDDDEFIKGVDISLIEGYILKILEKYDEEDEVDLFTEFKKGGFPDSTVYDNPYKKEYYILIIMGANKEKVSSDSYITENSSDLGLDIAHFFAGIPKTNIEVLANASTLSSQKYKTFFPYQYSNQIFAEYTDMEDLVKKLNDLGKICPFDLVIDASSLNNYSIDNNTVISKKVLLDFFQMFPNSKIIDIEEKNYSSKKQLLLDIKEYLKSYNIIANVAEQVDVYSKQQTDKKETFKDLESFCEKVKEKVLKKG